MLAIKYGIRRLLCSSKRLLWSSKKHRQRYFHQRVINAYIYNCATGLLTCAAIVSRRGSVRLPLLQLYDPVHHRAGSTAHASIQNADPPVPVLKATYVAAFL